MGALRRLDRPRRVALALALVLAASGALLALFAPEPRVPVPVVSSSSIEAPELTYVRSLPDAGDAALRRPVGLAVADGQVYVADSEAAVVRVFTTGGFDQGTVGAGQCEVPVYLAADEATGTLYVTDRELGAVLRFSSDGERLADLRPSAEPTATWEPLGIAVDGRGAVAVTDSSGRHRVLLMDRDGDVRYSLGQADATGTPGEVSVALDFPNSVALSAAEMWVSDSNNKRVLVFNRQGVFERSVDVDAVVRGLCFMTGGADPLTFVAVADTLGSQIVLLAEDGAEVARYGEPGVGAGRLAYPNDVAYDPASSQLFVADTGNARVQVWRVVWPGDRGALDEALGTLRLSPMRVAGLGAILAALVLCVVALWPQRKGGTEPAIVTDTL